MRQVPVIVAFMALSAGACASGVKEESPTTEFGSASSTSTVASVSSTTVPPVEAHIGVGLSPRSYEGTGLPDFLSLIHDHVEVLMHAGAWAELQRPQPSFTVIAGVAAQQGLDTLFVLSAVVPGAAPLDRTGRAALVDALRTFLSTNHPAYLGLGNEVNKLADDDPAEFEQVVALWAEALPVVREVSPDTKVFVTFQYEWMLGHRGGWFGGADVAADWSALDRFPGADMVGFTTYPSLVFDDPTALPVDYYTQIAGHTGLPVLFTESGWSADDTLPLLPGSEQEQLAFIDVLEAQASALRAEVLVWSFVFGDQIQQPAFKAMTLRRADGTARPSWDRWLALAAA